MMTKLYRSCATVLWISTIVIWQPVLCYGANKYSESDAAKYLVQLNRENAQWSNRVSIGIWNWMTNITQENADKSSVVDAEFAKFEEGMHQEMQKYSWASYSDPNIKRQHKLISDYASGGMPKERIKQYRESVFAMQNVYNLAIIPEYGKRHSNRSLSKEPDITDKAATSFDLDERKHMWTEWANSTGKKIRHLFPEYVKQSNEHAKLRNYKHTADYWLRSYELYDFRGRVERLWYQIRPLYLQLHAYVRRKLWERYGDSVVSRRGPIPVHLIDDIWTQSWVRLVNFTLPYPDEVNEFDPTAAMIKQRYTVEKMFKLAEKSYTSMNLSAMPHSFWERSVFEKPKDRKMLCQPSAWDFQDSKDYRISQCASVNFKDLLTAYHEMGHIQYYMHYKDQPFIYREGANAGFAEAVADTFFLSASTPRHMHHIGLATEKNRTPKADINHLYRIAMEQITLLPFGYIMDMYRWHVFDGASSEDTYNSDWWELRYIYQGLVPPVPRSEDDFDPGTKSLIIENLPYLEYFLSYIMKFQFHQALCEKAFQFTAKNPKKRPLHECDIYQSATAGNAFKELLKLGKSRPWFDAMEALTGEREMNAGPLLNYFLPLHEWLVKENQKTDELIGWEQDTSMCLTVGGEKCQKHTFEESEYVNYHVKSRSESHVQSQSKSHVKNQSEHKSEDLKKSD